MGASLNVAPSADAPRRGEVLEFAARLEAADLPSAIAVDVAGPCERR
ncbi:hypothetical protein ACFWDI_17905 [Streptomyces sp. NPDC060064]